MNISTEEDSARSRGRPYQLLKVLIAMGGKEVNSEIVAETLWPHVDKDYSIKSLTINLHRLRRLFGNDDTILLREGRLSVNSNMVWLDVWAIEHHISRIESDMTIPGKIRNESDIDALFGRMVEIYRGPFLEDDEEYLCFVTARNHYRAEFIKGTNLLVDMLNIHGNPARAPDYYEKGIQKDPSAEALYRRLMNWYQDADRPVDALEVYERCRVAMARTSQKVPSAETQSIYNKMVELAG